MKPVPASAGKTADMELAEMGEFRSVLKNRVGREAAFCVPVQNDFARPPRPDSNRRASSTNVCAQGTVAQADQAIKVKIVVFAFSPNVRHTLRAPRPTERVRSPPNAVWSMSICMLVGFVWAFARASERARSDEKMREVLGLDAFGIAFRMQHRRLSTAPVIFNSKEKAAFNNSD